MVTPNAEGDLYPLLRACKKQHLGKGAFRQYDAHAIGIGQKIVSGKPTDTLCLRFYVSCKHPTDRIAPDRRVPAAFRIWSQRDGREVELPTDVIEQPPMRFTADPTDRFRPVPGGVSGGSVFTGTIGGWAWDRTDASFVMLTACHVVGFFDVVVLLNGPMLQPGLSDGGDVTDDRVGTVKRLIELQAGETRTVDAAIAEPTNTDMVQTVVLNVGSAIYAVDTPTLGMAVQKSGKSSGLTQGQVVDADVDTAVFLADDIFFFEDVVQIQASDGGVWAEPGDSGSVVFSQAGLPTSSAIHPAVGLHFASSTDADGLACKMRNVFEQLDLAPICDGLFADFVEEMAVAPGFTSPDADVSPAAGLHPFTPRERRWARAGSPARGLGRDLQTRLDGSGSGRQLNTLVSAHRAALTELMIRNGDVRRAAVAAIGPILSGAVTTSDVLSRRICAQDVKRLQKLIHEIERSGDKKLVASVQAMAKMLEVVEGKSLSDLFEQGAAY